MDSRRCWERARSSELGLEEKEDVSDLEAGGIWVVPLGQAALTEVGGPPRKDGDLATRPLFSLEPHA